MPINLSKGQKVDLTKGNPGLKKIMTGLGWLLPLPLSQLRNLLQDHIESALFHSTHPQDE